MSKQFRVSYEEKGGKMWAGSVNIPVGTVRRVLAVDEQSGRDTVAITVSLEWLVSLSQTVAYLVGPHLVEPVGQEKVSSDVELGAGSGIRGRLLRLHSLRAQQEMSRSSWSVVQR